MKIREVLKNGIFELNRYDIQEAKLKAEILLEYELKLSNEKLICLLEEEISSKQMRNFDKNLQKLIQGMPVQYITNCQNFYGLDLYVDKNVLIPQPDTEILVEEVIKIAKKMSEKPRILDVCTGSGAIAIALDKNIKAEIVASDISPKALEIAKKNAMAQKAKIKLVESDMFDKIEGKFDVIVSNPPYIRTEIIKQLSAEVKNEPVLALDGGKDGLEFYRILTEKSREYLKNNGVLAVEIGYDQKEQVIEIFQKSGFCQVDCKKDFGGNNRVVVGKWREICRSHQR